MLGLFRSPLWQQSLLVAQTPEKNMLGGEMHAKHLPPEGGVKLSSFTHLVPSQQPRLLVQEASRPEHSQ